MQTALELAKVEGAALTAALIQGVRRVLLLMVVATNANLACIFLVGSILNAN